VRIKLENKPMGSFSLLMRRERMVLRAEIA
jgi:hypothetical protein